MKKIIIFIVLVFINSIAFSKIEKWNIDEAHTKIGFEVSHLIISSVEGRFNKFNGAITFDISEKDPTKIIAGSSFEVDINADSIETGNMKRDNHLKSPDFFNVKKAGHEKITFKSTKIFTANGKKLKVTGNLTINNVTKRVTIVFKYLGTAQLYDIRRIAFIGDIRIKREDYGLSWNDGAVKASTVTGKLVETSGAVGSMVKINLKIEATIDSPK